MKLINYILILFFFCASCNKDQPLVKTKILGHKGSGSYNKYNNPYFDNSIKAIVFSLQNLDGSEVDIQMSKDSTLWLFHDNHIRSCEDSLINFCLLTDDEIYTFSQCNYRNSLAPLSNLFLMLDTCNYQNKFLSLDLKGLINPLALSIYKKDFLFKHYASFIQSYAKEQAISLAIETKHAAFLTMVNNSVDTYLLELNNLDSAIFIANKNKFNGISCHFKKLLKDTTLLKKTHKKNLKLQVWTPSKPKDINLVLPLRVDYLQTDNLYYFIN